MVRLFAFLSALVMALTSAWLSARGAESLLLFVQAHPLPKSSGPRIAVFISIFAGLLPSIMLATKSRRRRSTLDEDVSRTPRVRRHPSGLREL
jgi:hypothetical protein